jgi:hypothetical protein
MNILKSVLVLCSLILLTHVLQVPQAYSSDVTAAQVNGTWSSKTGTFKVWVLGKQRLQVEFYGEYDFKTSAGPIAHTSKCSGIAFIEGDTATFKPEGSDEELQDHNEIQRRETNSRARRRMWVRAGCRKLG